jgi:hypothetical protein
MSRKPLRQEIMSHLDHIPVFSKSTDSELKRPAARPRRMIQALSLCSVGLLLGASGCASVTGSPVVSQVRIIDASPDTPGIDVYQGTGVLAYNLGLGTITSYVPTTQGTFSINVDLAGTRQQLTSAYGTFLAGGQYTVVVGNFSTSLQETILKDQSIPAPAGQVDVRFIAQSTRSGPVDIYLIPSGSTITQVRPALAGVVFGTNSGYLNIPNGTYTISVLPAGTVPTAATTTYYTSAATNYPSGTARTIVLIDQQLITTPGVQAVIADDYDPVGAPN